MGPTGANFANATGESPAMNNAITAVTKPTRIVNGFDPLCPPTDMPDAIDIAAPSNKNSNG